MNCLLCRCQCRYTVCECGVGAKCPGCEPDCKGVVDKAAGIVLGPVRCQACRRVVALRRGRGDGLLGWEDEPGVLHRCDSRREVCVCGGVIRVPGGQDPTPVVRLHQNGPTHIAWTMGIPARPVSGTFQRDGHPVQRHG